MTSSQFFETIQKQYSKNLPFAAFQRPKESKINAFLQKNDIIYNTSDFTENGFVFAPFDMHREAVIIPIENALKIDCDFLLDKNDSVEPKIASSISNRQKTVIDEIQFKINHQNLIQKGIKAIEEGVLEKVVLSRKEIIALAEEHPITIFQKLLKEYENAFVYVWYHPKIGLWLGASPEILLKVDDYKLTTMALAGTQTYHGTLNTTWGRKEREEQQLVTDTIVRSLKDSVAYLNVSEVETVRAGNLLHLQSNIEADIKKDSFNLKKILDVLHPTPAVCGLPKEKAKEFILSNETYNREFYTGFLGVLEFGFAELYVNLRCMQFKDEKALIYIGGGITKDSIVEKEWEETVNKAKTMKKVL